MPLIATPAISLSPLAASTSSSQIALKSAHQTVSASCSAQPGLGNDRWWGCSERATTSPFKRTSTPLDEPVPMSIPTSSSSAMRSPFVA